MQSIMRSHQNGIVRVTVPASTSNLGPGFDTLGLALKLYTRLSFDPSGSSEPGLEVIGAEGSSLPRDKTNLVFRLLAERISPTLLAGMHICIDTDIPLARGLGSSGAAIIGTLWAAERLSGRCADNSQLLTEATRVEGHPDNMSASLLGGLVVSGWSADGSRALATRLTWPEEWAIFTVVPGYELSTAKARSVLPGQVSRQDAVFNVQRVALLLAAVANRDEDLLAEAMHDKLHEPYRMPLVPELASLRTHLTGSRAMGCTLSGAGPTLLVLGNRQHAEEILDAINAWSCKQATAMRVMQLDVDNEGLREG